jgi:hypothetical protein
MHRRNQTDIQTDGQTDIDKVTRQRMKENLKFKKNELQLKTELQPV